MSEEPKYGYPNPAPAQAKAQEYYQGPPVMAPPQYAAPAPQKDRRCFEEFLAALCFCGLLEGCCELLCSCCF